MKIKKSYELRQIDDKVVVVGYSIDVNSPLHECMTSVLLVADELLANSEQRVSPSDTIFAMRVGEQFVICRDDHGKLYISQPCTEYQVVHDQVLLFSDMWYLWAPLLKERGYFAEPLGMPMWENFCELFLAKDNNSKNAPYALKYFENGSLVRVNCKEFEQFAKNRQDAKCIPPFGSFAYERTYCNVARVVDEKGKVLWLSIKEEIESDYSTFSHKFRGFNHYYHYLFTPERYKE